MTEKRMEDFFLKTIHRISFAGVLFIGVMDMIFMQMDNFLGIGGMVDVGILVSICVAMFLHKNGYYVPAVILPTSFAAAALLLVSVLHFQSVTTAMIALVS